MHYHCCFICTLLLQNSMSQIPPLVSADKAAAVVTQCLPEKVRAVDNFGMSRSLLTVCVLVTISSCKITSSQIFRPSYRCL